MTNLVTLALAVLAYVAVRSGDPLSCLVVGMAVGIHVSTRVLLTAVRKRRGES